MTYKPADTLEEMPFDGWMTEDAVSDAVGLVEYESAELGERGELAEQKIRGRSPKLPAGLDDHQVPRNARERTAQKGYAPERTGRNPRRQPRQALGIDSTPPGVLASTVDYGRGRSMKNHPVDNYDNYCEDFATVNPFAPPSPELGRQRIGADLQRFVTVRWQQFCQGLPWRLAWLSSLAVGSAALIVSAGRWQQGTTVTDAGLRDQCVEVTNAQGEVAAEKANGAAALVGKNRQALTKALGAPYCALPKTSVRAGAVVDRSLYQLPGDREMVVALEGDKVIGYGIESASGGGDGAVGDRQDFDLRQSWSWLTGSTVADREVIGGLGSVALVMDGPVYAPMDGVVFGEAALVAEGQLSRLPDSCAVFTSVQLPAYAVQLCGLRDRTVGDVIKGKEIGRGNGLVHLAVLRRDGKQWMFVPPAPEIVEQILGEAA
ncbi:MAG: hypothetical protein ACFCA4_14530 [Cyanophyceae cyanobacterium]